MYVLFRLLTKILESRYTYVRTQNCHICTHIMAIRLFISLYIFVYVLNPNLCTDASVAVTLNNNLHGIVFMYRICIQMRWAWVLWYCWCWCFSFLFFSLQFHTATKKCQLENEKYVECWKLSFQNYVVAYIYSPYAVVLHTFFMYCLN